jgi:hypothetical protein
MPPNTYENAALVKLYSWEFIISLPSQGIKSELDPPVIHAGLTGNPSLLSGQAKRYTPSLQPDVLQQGERIQLTALSGTMLGSLRFCLHMTLLGLGSLYASPFFKFSAN